jgi:predicted esterase YcpF (UPF0227 family)
MKLDLENLIAEVTEPRMVLHLGPRPAFVGSEIGGCWANEVEDLKDMELLEQR